MHCNRSADRAAQRAVIGIVLEAHPGLFAREEIAREIGDLEETERAIGELAASGLVRLEGSTVIATRAALAFEELG